MALFTPTYFAEKITDINSDFLKKINIRGIILDIDDTLVPHKYPLPNQETLEWLNKLNQCGIKTILVSNNFKKRVQDFAAKLNLPYIHMGMKPLTPGIKRAVKFLDIPKENILVIGDQIFTDIVGANILKIKSLLVDPLSKSKTALLKIKRFIEKPLREKIKKNTNLNI